MTFQNLKNEVKKTVLTAQNNEITEYFIYKKLSQSMKNPNQRKVLKRISEDELKHYKFWRKITEKDVKPDKLKIWWYYIISRLFGLTFGIKLMERGEEQAQITYEKIAKSLPDAEAIVDEEDRHEKELIAMIDEERLEYVGSMILGLNDALVELTGALSGFTFALQNTRLIALTGLITGIAASLSMATSEYLSTKSEGGSKSPLKAALYTGIAYIFTVIVLILPYLLFTNVFQCLGLTALNALLIILVFTFYISVAKDLQFKKRFVEMAMISLGVTALTFIIGFLVRSILHIEI
jgi:VIT1/CCC1 family predicted Fe2+/Mn2+ transporter